MKWRQDRGCTETSTKNFFRVPLIQIMCFHDWGQGAQPGELVCCVFKNALLNIRKSPILQAINLCVAFSFGFSLGRCGANSLPDDVSDGSSHAWWMFVVSGCGSAKPRPLNHAAIADRCSNRRASRCERVPPQQRVIAMGDSLFEDAIFPGFLSRGDNATCVPVAVWTPIHVDTKTETS